MFVAIVFAEGGWGAAYFLSEVPTEIAQISETALITDCAYWKLGSDQHLLGGSDAA